MSRPIVPPATIGMLGGGQLGRYALVAARPMGYRTVVLEPDPPAPAGRGRRRAPRRRVRRPGRARSAGAHVRRRHDRVREPAGGGARAAGRATGRRAVGRRPSRSPRTGSPRSASSTRNGFPVAPYAAVERTDAAAGRRAGDPQDGAARLRRQGPARRPRRSRRSAAAWRELGGVPCVLERRVALEAEVSVVVARTAGGADGHVRGRREPPRRRHPRPDGRAGPGRRRAGRPGAGPGGDDRRRARLRRRARRRVVRRRRRAVRQRARPAAAQQRALDARRRRDQPVRPAGPGRVRPRPRLDRR